MISKELLSEVLNCYIHSFDYRDVLCYKNTIRYWLTPNSQSMPNVINIYELAHKCKEWAKDKGFILWSTVYGFERYGFERYIDGHGFTNFQDIRFMADTEPEAIFKACQWLLDNKDEK